MPCRKSIFFLLFLRGSSQVSLPFWFCADGIRNPTQLFLFRFLHSHRSLNQTMSPPTSSYSFAQATAMIISALLCLNKSSLFAKTLHPATDAPSWTNSLAAFHDLVSTICSSIVMIEDVFLPCKFWHNQRWHSSYYSW